VCRRGNPTILSLSPPLSHLRAYTLLQLRAIEALTNICNTIKSKNIDIQKFMHAAPTTPVSGIIRDLVRTSVANSAALAVPITLTRGCATIPLSGIDVPFHSAFLKPGVGSFRRCLHQYIAKENVDIKQLERKYIPNLTAKPFEVSKTYFEDVYRVTGSEVLKKVLDEVRYSLAT
jgi:fatty acid synthase subunit beta, fungi type